MFLLHIHRLLKSASNKPDRFEDPVIFHNKFTYMLTDPLIVNSKITLMELLYICAIRMRLPKKSISDSLDLKLDSLHKTGLLDKAFHDYFTSIKYSIKPPKPYPDLSKIPVCCALELYNLNKTFFKRKNVMNEFHSTNTILYSRLVDSICADFQDKFLRKLLNSFIPFYAAGVTKENENKLKTLLCTLVYSQFSLLDEHENTTIPIIKAYLENRIELYGGSLHET